MRRTTVFVAVTVAALVAVTITAAVAFDSRDARPPAPAAAAADAAPRELAGVVSDWSVPIGVQAAEADPPPEPPRAAVPGSPAPAAAAEPAAHAVPTAARRVDLRLDVTPACARRGERLVARVIAAAGSQVSLVVAYADGRNHGEMFAGAVGDDGSFEFPWTVPPGAATGTGHVYVAGHDPADDRSATSTVAFEVAGGC